MSVIPGLEDGDDIMTVVMMMMAMMAMMVKKSSQKGFKFTIDQRARYLRRWLTSGGWSGNRDRPPS